MKKIPQFFFIYINENIDKITEIYKSLSDKGFKPWMASMDILPGMNWKDAIINAMRDALLIFIFLSEAFAKRAGWQKFEIEKALEISKEKPGDSIFLVPVRLEECAVPRELEHIQVLDLFEKDGWKKLMMTVHQVAGPSLPQPEPPEELVQACAEGGCVLYGGAGLSAPAGLPTWRNFVEGLLEWTIKNRFVEEKSLESLLMALKQGDIDLVADRIVSDLEENDKEKSYYSYLKEIFSLSNPRLPEYYQILKKIPFSAVLTTNLDNLFEIAYSKSGGNVYTPADTEPLLNSLHNREFFILKLYGTLDQPHTVLLSPAQYEDMVAGNLSFSEFMESLFFSRTIVFVGASLEGIEDYLEGLKFPGYTPRQHYALAAVTGSAWEAKADMLQKRYGIRILPYSLSRKHEEVAVFLKKLAQKTGKKKTKERALRSVSVEKIVPAQDGLKRIVLENIGTFSKLELELNKGWNILLGDNGVGKSTILKAIAVGICGKDAQPYAHRLIKSGKTEASILLETGRNRYKTTLFKRNGRAEVKTIGRFLETEGWLAAGFPPLRTVSWQRPKGPQLEEGISRPTSGDLLPLIADEPDPRTDRLKQWIINMDYYRSKSRKKGSKKEDYYGALLEDFFQVIDQLTRGLTFRFKEVDLSSRQVTVISDDGEIPLEAASQGTISLIGWIGILLQRLYEVYRTKKGNPREQSALVLIDEIDAHMHPFWQQTLIPGLEEVFPYIQFIATTHSPLIVGSREPEEVFFLRREKKTPDHVTVDKLRESFRGWRADQILTSPLFALSSSREPATWNLLMRYSELAAKDPLTSKEQEELEKAARELKVRVPSPGERAEARKASQLIRETWKTRLKEMQPGERKKIIEEINLQVLESVTGSGGAQ